MLPGENKNKAKNRGKKVKAITKKTKGMSKKKLSYEWRRINYFFELYDQEGAPEHLWEMLKLSLTYGE